MENGRKYADNDMYAKVNVMGKEIRFSTYWKNEKTSDVVIVSDRSKVEYKRYSDEICEAPFGFDNPSFEQMYRFLESRCMPKGRQQLQEYLDDLGLAEYNVYEILRKTHGVMWEDFLWLKFEGESVTWDEVKVRD